MDSFNNFWVDVVDIVWGLPLVILLISAGLYFTILNRFLPIRGFRHALAILRGRFDRHDDPGEISHFQALTAALSATLGMGNIAGVVIAISAGGPGAIFWMWIAGLVGMSTKFFTCTLAVMYRKQDSRGIEQGGPMYYLEVGLGRWAKPLALMFAICGMVGCLALFQINQLSGLLHDDWGVSRLLVGVICVAVVGIVILGGIIRVGQVTSKVVPFMFLLYFFSALYIVGLHAAQVPEMIVTIVKSAFGGQAIAGGAAGYVMKQALITGVRRAAFSNEAGMGTAPMAHGAAKTKEPVREGLIAMLGPFFDTNIVCTLTALVVLFTNVVPMGEDAGLSDQTAVVLTVKAFAMSIPSIGRYLMTLVVILFSLSTLISYSYYSQKCAKYVFGDKLGAHYVYVYIGSLILGAVWTQATVINILDTAFALMSIPTVIGALLLSPKVRAATKDYFRRMGL